ncbi:MAG: helix-turn-helix domain-containing protein [Candidatus Caenarcaniphilales bacterium]|nr:helix-turn-helix domain-containing protein [Candidatus Caenarcaniphilales bacterium]
MVTSTPIPPNEEETAQAKKIEEQLNLKDFVDNPSCSDQEEAQQNFQLQLNGKAFPIPATMRKLLISLIRNMAEGKAVTLIPLDSELTTQQAADYLNVSRPYLIGLLNEGKIDYRKVGKHRRVLFKDLVIYKEESYKRSMEALDEITKTSQELGLYK